MVHRLDKGTSGVLIIAKTPRAEAHLGSAFRGRSTRKTYVALLSGLPRLPASGQWVGAVRERGVADGGGVAVDAPIGQAAYKGGGASRGRMAVAADGKPASSVVHVHAYSHAHGLTLASVELHTGR
jgi:23S rRNA-/tRNA-specific pseudouridylate synthase